MTYATEFPAFVLGNDAHGTAVRIPNGFDDESWHNDAMPSWYHERDSVRLWIDWADPTQRDTPEFPRFLVFTEVRDDDGGILSEKTLAASDNWMEILEAIAAHRESKS
jgi:hypothetical protein